MKQILRISFGLLTLSASLLAKATPYYGVRGSIELVPKEPAHTSGFQFNVSYDPQSIQWRNFNIYFDLGFSHFSDSSAHGYSGVNIYAIAPVVRSTFHRRGPVVPFLEISIGASYLNHTHFERRNLGIHYAFQDRFGIGVLLGAAEQFSIGVHAVHYSNAKLCVNNAGISVPLLLDLGYRF